MLRRHAIASLLAAGAYTKAAWPKSIDRFFDLSEQPLSIAE